jgi:hypothetical protein
MRLLVLSAAIAATVLGALPASAEIIVRSSGDGIVVRDHDRDGDHDRRDFGRSHRDWRRSHAECREMRVRTRSPSGHIVYRMQRSCN